MQCLLDTVLPPHHLPTSDGLLSGVRNVLCLSQLAKRLDRGMQGHDLAPIVKRLSAARTRFECSLLQKEMSKECLGWELGCSVHVDRNTRPLGERSKLYSHMRDSLRSIEWPHPRMNFREEICRS